MEAVTIDKPFVLELIKLLAAVETWSFANKSSFPDFLYEKIDTAVERLSEEILK